MTPKDFVTCSVSLSSGAVGISSSSMLSLLELRVGAELPLPLPEMASMAVAGPVEGDPLVIRDRTSPSNLSIRFCMLSGVDDAELCCWEAFFRVVGCA